MMALEPQRIGLTTLLAFLAACSGSSPPSVVSAGSGDGGIAGSATGAPFAGVRAALWIGSPDDAATTVIYVFSADVACSDLQAAGWDRRIQDHTQVLEMKLLGTAAPTTFAVTSSHTPALGEAAVNYTESSRAGTPAETFASAGTVSLQVLSAAARATGTFDVRFPGGSLTGGFDAAFCPGGHEP